MRCVIVGEVWAGVKRWAPKSWVRGLWGGKRLQKKKRRFLNFKTETGKKKKPPNLPNQPVSLRCCAAELPLQEFSNWGISGLPGGIHAVPRPISLCFNPTKSHKTLSQSVNKLEESLSTFHSYRPELNCASLRREILMSYSRRSRDVFFSFFLVSIMIYLRRRRRPSLNNKETLLLSVKGETSLNQIQRQRETFLIGRRLKGHP